MPDPGVPRLPTRPTVTAPSGGSGWERFVGGVLAVCAGVSALVTVGIILVLLSETVAFFSSVSFWEYLSETRWTPLFQEKHFGVLPLLSGSLLVTVGAGIIALPAGLLTAVFLSEYAGPRLRKGIRPVLEVLAGIPTVVYGYFALTFVTPVLQFFFPGTGAFNAASAAIVVGIMILPTVSFLSEESLRAVPASLREGAVALGANRLDVTARIVIPAGLPGVLASFVLALSRAFGETMAVSIAAGNSPRLTLNPLESIQTLTAYIVQVGQGGIPVDPLAYRTLFAVGMTLFVLTLGMNLVGQWVRTRLHGSAP